MKTIMKSVFSAVMAFCLAAMLLPPVAPLTADAAESGTKPKRFNIMLVIDGSGSLETGSKTDPDRMRYELVSDLLGNIENDGHNIGAVVFSGTTGTDTADASMERGILLNTGLHSLDAMAPNGLPVKEYIYDQIVETGYDLTIDGTTDVGTALQVAQRTLLSKQQENGLESLLFLFTDGITDLPTRALKEKSSANLDAATAAISAANNARLMGIFLNKNGKLPTGEIRGIVCAANGITEASEEFANSYVEIHDAASAHNAVAVMLRFMGYISKKEPEVLYGDLNDTFRIPGIGVEEMNIRLYSPEGVTLPQMDVVLIKPDGTEIKGTELTAMGRFGRTFHVYKLIAPAPGTWKLQIKVPEGNTVGYCYDPVISLYIEAGITPSSETDTWHVNKEVTLSGHLSQGGTVITDPVSYREYACTLQLTNLLDGTVETYDIPNNNSGKFELPLKLSKYGKFSSQIFFTCDEITVAGDVTEFLLENKAPTTSTSAKVEVTYGLFRRSLHSIDLTQYFEDTEDGTDLTVRLLSTDCPTGSYTLDGTTLILNAGKLKNNTVELEVADSQGATATLQLAVVSRSVTAVFLLLLIAILAVIFVAVILVITRLNAIRPKGILSLTVAFRDETAGTQSHTLYLGVPNVDAPANTNLRSLFAKVLHDKTQMLPHDIQTAFSGFYTAAEEELSAIRIDRILQLHKGKLTGAVRVTHNETKDVLFNSSYATDISGVSYTLTFSVAEDTDSSESGDPEGSNQSGQAGGSAGTEDPSL